MHIKVIHPTQCDSMWLALLYVTHTKFWSLPKYPDVLVCFEMQICLARHWIETRCQDTPPPTPTPYTLFRTLQCLMSTPLSGSFERGQSLTDQPEADEELFATGALPDPANEGSALLREKNSKQPVSTSWHQRRQLFLHATFKSQSTSHCRCKA